METRLRLEILAQPDDTTCGPTCLHAVYRYYTDELPLEKVIFADPLRPNPVSQMPHYEVNIDRVIASILLGVLTYDANLLIITPRQRTKERVP